MLRKYRKFDALERYHIGGYLEGPIFSYGRVGSGKSVCLMSLSQGFHDQYSYKIFDLDGGPRCEQLYWAIPSQDKEYWKRFSNIGTFDEEGPKQYKVNFLYPFFGSKMPKKLPIKKHNEQMIVDSKVFTIPLKSITKEDICVVVGNLSDNSKYGWNEIQNKATKKDNAGSLLNLCKNIKRISDTPLYKNFVVPMSREKFIMDNYCPYNIDLISEAKNKEVITVLCLDFVPRDFQLFVLNWICRNLSELLDANKIPKKNIALIREAGRYFTATADSILPDEYKIFRANMANYIRLGRRGLYFSLDCQSPSETRGLVQGCLNENTKIATVDKHQKIIFKSIKDLPKTFSVYSINFENNETQINSAKKIFTGNKECYEIIFENGEKVIATEEHRFFDKNAKEVKVKNLKIGDKLIFKNA